MPGWRLGLGSWSACKALSHPETVQLQTPSHHSRTHFSRPRRGQPKGNFNCIDKDIKRLFVMQPDLKVGFSQGSLGSQCSCSFVALALGIHQPAEVGEPVGWDPAGAQLG